MSEVVNIPKLRFPGFSEEWGKVKLNDVLTLLTDFEANGSFASVKENVTVFDEENYAWYVRATDLEKNTNLENVKYVDEHSYTFLRKTPLFGQELLITKRGEIGKVYFFNPKEYIKATLAPNLYLLKLNEKVDSKFIYLFFINEKGNKKLKRINASSTIGALYKDDVKAIKMVVPSRPEQEKIASFLSTVDNKIEQLSKKQALLGEYKKGLMQQVFSQAIRFKADDGSEFPDWEEKKLRDVLDYEQPTNYIVESTEYNNSFVTPVLTAGKTFILGYSNETHNIFHKLPVIIFDDFTTANKYVDFPFKVKSSAMKILKPKDSLVNIKLLFEFIQMLNFPIGEHKRYWISEYQDLKVPFPSFIEQTKIANFLFSIDSKIEQIGKQLDETKQFKKALLQQMFI